LEFYSDKSIAHRQERWESEGASQQDDDTQYCEEGEPALSRKGALRALGHDGELVQRITDLLEADEYATAENLSKHYALAMELHAAIERGDGEHDPFKLFDIALGSGELLSWLTDLPRLLAQEGLPQEGALLAKAWADIAEPESFLADRAVILAEAGKTDEALAQIKENAECFPDDVQVQIKLGDAYEALDYLPAAEEQYRKALAAAPAGLDRAAAKTRLAELLRRTGRAAEAEGLESVRKGRQIGRNDPCPCGSGKKYKKCCLDKET
jgi:uncharacterized protein YecA (UPF0149 family)